MTARELRAVVPCPAEVLLDRLRCFEHEAEDLSVTAAGDGYRWRLAFRGSAVTWTQHAHLRADGAALVFEQTVGDLISLRGEWEVGPAAAGSEVRYTVDYRTSVAHLAGAIDPVLGRVLLRAAVAVLTAVAPPVRIVDGEQWLNDLPPELRHLLPTAPVR